jgi:hypothetical protein
MEGKRRHWPLPKKRGDRFLVGSTVSGSSLT